MRRQRRLGAHLAALAFEAFQQRGLLAADIGAGADAHFEIEAVRRAADARAEIAGALGGRDRRVHGLDRVRIFRADIDVALVAPTAKPAMVMPSISTKGSPSMIMRSAKVPLSPSSALQTMYFWSALVVRHGLPLDAGRETRRRRGRAGRTR